MKQDVSEEAWEEAAVVALAQGRLALQLRLTGMRVEEPANQEEAVQMLESLLEESLGILVVAQDLLDQIDPGFLEQSRREDGLPIIVSGPTFDERTDLTSYISEVLLPAVGYEIRID